MCFCVLIMLLCGEQHKFRELKFMQIWYKWIQMTNCPETFMWKNFFSFHTLNKILFVKTKHFLGFFSRHFWLIHQHEECTKQSLRNNSQILKVPFQKQVSSLKIHQLLGELKTKGDTAPIFCISSFARFFTLQFSSFFLLLFFWFTVLKPEF